MFYCISSSSFLFLFHASNGREQEGMCRKLAHVFINLFSLALIDSNKNIKKRNFSFWYCVININLILFVIQILNYLDLILCGIYIF